MTNDNFNQNYISIMSVYFKRTAALNASRVKAGWILIGCHF